MTGTNQPSQNKSYLQRNHADCNSSLRAASHAEILTKSLPFVLQKFKTQALWQDWALCESVYEEKITKTARDSRLPRI